MNTVAVLAIFVPLGGLIAWRALTRTPKRATRRPDVDLERQAVERLYATGTTRATALGAEIERGRARRGLLGDENPEP